MKKFTNLGRSQNTPTIREKQNLYDDKKVKLTDYDGQTIITTKDCVVCIPLLLEENKFIIRQEYIPAYKIADGQELHLALVGGSIEKGETPEEALLREIQEEAGLVLREDYKIDFDKPLYLGKGSTTKCHMAILPLTDRDYHEIVIKGDGSQVEKRSQTIKVDVKYLNAMNSSDILTEFYLMKLKSYLNL